VLEQQNQSRKYLEAQIRTASKEQLLLMLYDGAIQNCTNALELLEANDFEKASDKLIKAQNIVAELISSLHFDKNQEVSKNLAALYGYIYIQLMEANTKHSILQIQNSIKILSSMKDTWMQAFEKVGLSAEGKPAEVATPTVNSDSKVRTSLSIQA
jgi:flagellar protein FliS